MPQGEPGRASARFSAGYSLGAPNISSNNHGSPGQVPTGLTDDVQWLLDLATNDWNNVPSNLSGIELLGFNDDLGCDPCDVNVPSHQEVHTNAFRGEQILESSQTINIDPQLLALTTGLADASSSLTPLQFSLLPGPIERADSQTFPLVSSTSQRSTPLSSKVDTLQTISPSASPGYSQSTTASSPASAAPQTSCEFCMATFNNVDSLCTHIITHHNYSRPLLCGRRACNREFKDARTLKRHLKSIHCHMGYSCRCGHLARKDKHLDHLRSNNCIGRGLYRCICGHHDVPQIEMHKAHVSHCGIGKKGRPKK